MLVGGSDDLVVRVARDVAAPRWANASKHWDGRGLAEGGDVTCVERITHVQHITCLQLHDAPILWRCHFLQYSVCFRERRPRMEAVQSLVR